MRALAGVAAVVSLVLMVFYFIPGVTHPLVGDDPTGIHLKHALLFGGLGVLSLIWLRFSMSAGRR